ncbi:Uncharacterised protein [Mycobacteroides abscessus]|nr:Uncharacterised protein [Mycobacteroides abscessus]SKS35348.1 Uncharacterised protein [Mycobacteroides abscessus subsp. abscessus]
MPYIPTEPSHHGCAWAHATTSAVSRCSTSSNMPQSPLDAPVPRTSITACTYPLRISASLTPNVARPPPGSARASSESSNRRGFLGGTSGTVTPRRRSPRSSQAARWVIDLLYGVRFNSTGSRSATGVPSASAGRNT